MTIENPIESHITGPAQTINEKAEALLNTISLYVIRNDPLYCEKTLEIVEWFYSKNNKKIPYEIRTKIEEINKILKG